MTALFALAVAAALSGHGACLSQGMPRHQHGVVCALADGTFTRAVLHHGTVVGVSWGWVDTGSGCIEEHDRTGLRVTTCPREQPGKHAR